MSSACGLHGGRCCKTWYACSDPRVVLSPGCSTASLHLSATPVVLVIEAHSRRRTPQHYLPGPPNLSTGLQNIARVYTLLACCSIAICQICSPHDTSLLPMVKLEPHILPHKNVHRASRWHITLQHVVCALTSLGACHFRAEHTLKYREVKDFSCSITMHIF